MEARQQQHLRRFDCALQFLDANEARIPPELIVAQRREMEGVVRAIREHATEQSRCKQGPGGPRLKELRRQLYEWHLRPVVVVANHLGVVQGSPLMMPLRSTTGYNLQAEASSVATRVGPVAHRLVGYGLAADFLDKLQAAIEALRQAEQDRQVSLRRRRGATHGLQAAVSKGCKVLGLLDATVRARAAGDEAVLLKWEVAKRG